MPAFFHFKNKTKEKNEKIKRASCVSYTLCYKNILEQNLTVLIPLSEWFPL